MSKKINVAIVGVGNCASALVQGVYGARTDYDRYDEIPGVMFDDVGGYTIHDIDFVTAFDVDKRKIGERLIDAIYNGTNCCYETISHEELVVMEEQLSLSNPVVNPGPLFDGVADHMRAKDAGDKHKFFIDGSEEDDFPIRDYTTQLKDAGVDVLLNYLPVGSEMATQFWARVCLESGVAMVNCIPCFISSDPIWAKKFIKARVPIVGDDMRSQFGASIVSAVLQELIHSRGLDVEMHYQDNIGGNTDFRNMLDQSRLASKKISKENVIRSQDELAGKETADDSIHAGPANYFPTLGDNKRAHWLIKARGFGGVPMEFTADLSVQDSANSGGVVVEAIRFAKVASELGIVGPVVGPSAWTQKTPPVDMHTHDALEECFSFANGIIPNDYIEIVGDDGEVYCHHRMYL